MKIIFCFLLLFIISSTFTSCNNEIINKKNKVNSEFKLLEEYDLLRIPLKGEISLRSAEISGLCWFGSRLIILPQYPNLFDPDTARIFYLEKDTLLHFINGNSEKSLSANYFNINLSNLKKYFTFGSGFESVTVFENNIFFTLEFLNGGQTETILIRGTIDSISNVIQIETESIVKDPIGLNIHNISDESIVCYNGQIIPIYEVFGQNLNKNPKVSVFNLNLEYKTLFDFPQIEYRITDATAVDDSGRFWAINYFYPGDDKKLDPEKDELFSKYGIGRSHKLFDPVERIIQFQILSGKIIISDIPPIYLKLSENVSRNWEGIVKLDDSGFIIATDTFPETILAYCRTKN